MPSHKITAVISFCSNDWRFLKQCIAGASVFCEQILVTVCDHFFDGSQENYALLQEAYRRFPQCTFIEFAFNPTQTHRVFSSLYPEHPDWRHEWHNTGRYLSYFFSKAETEYLLFLDCDEIVDGPVFLQWLEETDWKRYSAIRFASFYHFREAKFEALTQDDYCLLVKKAALLPDFLWDEDERMGLFHRMHGEKQLGVKGFDKNPMMRHYSGVRTQEELLKKFSTWGHHWERKWKDLMHQEFSQPFGHKDFIRGYHYREIEPEFDPLQEDVPSLTSISWDDHLKDLPGFANVIMVNQKETFKQQLEHDFALLDRDHH